MFFTKGVGVHKDRLASFEAALRDAKTAVGRCEASDRMPWQSSTNLRGGRVDPK
jgi:hypothetical protein